MLTKQVARPLQARSSPQSPHGALGTGRSHRYRADQPGRPIFDIYSRLLIAFHRWNRCDAFPDFLG